ncbi:MAG: response regulator transcription factor [Chloroflexi bacterium]|nr:response regulator transcription factor [Chloroflexota bacterium]
MINAGAIGDAANPKRLLIAEDDEEIRHLLTFKLTRVGFDVLTAPSGQHALDLIAEHGLPHLAIVDINMPIMGGLEFCERVKQFSDLPIIVLTAIDEPSVVIDAIERFAEDYVVKPFNLGELVARIQRVLRRVGDYDYAQKPVIQINQRLAVDLGHHLAIVDGKTILLTPTETKLLHIFLLNGDRPLSCEFLLGRVWPHEEVYEETLRVHISRLRQKIGDQPLANRTILTERGQGYRLNIESHQAPSIKSSSKPRPRM